jgi:hypothetical protein
VRSSERNEHFWRRDFWIGVKIDRMSVFFKENISVLPLKCEASIFKESIFWFALKWTSWMFLTNRTMGLLRAEASTCIIRFYYAFLNTPREANCWNESRFYVPAWTPYSLFPHSSFVTRHLCMKVGLKVPLSFHLRPFYRELLFSTRKPSFCNPAHAKYELLNAWRSNRCHVW